MDHRQVGEELWSRFATGSGDDVRWYYRALLEAFTARREELGDGGLRALEELGQTVDELG
jgi:hypothetical protein